MLGIPGWLTARGEAYSSRADLLQPSNICAQPLNLAVQVIPLAHLDADLGAVRLGRSDIETISVGQGNDDEQQTS